MAAGRLHRADELVVFSSRRRHTIFDCGWSSDVCSSDLDTTNVVTYLNISRTTFTAWRGTLTAQSGSLSLANLAADVDAAQVGNEIPTLGICPPAVFTIYEALLTPTVSHQYSANDYRF